jgi:hypothetical protein
MDVRQVVVFDPACHAKQVTRVLENYAQHLYTALQRPFQMLAMWIMSWDFDRTDQLFPFG